MKTLLKTTAGVAVAVSVKNYILCL